MLTTYDLRAIFMLTYGGSSYTRCSRTVVSTCKCVKCESIVLGSAHTVCCKCEARRVFSLFRRASAVNVRLFRLLLGVG